MSWQIGKQVKPTLIYTNEAWMDDAACRARDTNMFFPTRNDKIGTRTALFVCNRLCPVQRECLEYALSASINLEGIWGGVPERPRNKMRRERGRVAQPIRHGTEAGAKQHYRRGEQPCAACQEAARKASRLRRDRLRQNREQAS